MHRGHNATERSSENQEKCAKLTPAQADAIFFPKPGGKSKTARMYCADCPVISSCLKRQLRLGGPGFWAGTTEDERKRMAEFLDLVPSELDDFIPPVVRKKVYPVRPDANILSDPLYGVEGPSPEEELKMLDGLI